MRNEKSSGGASEPIENQPAKTLLNITIPEVPAQLTMNDWLQSSPLDSQEVIEEVAVHSVQELNRLIKGTLEGEFPLVWVRGEVSNFKPHYSGHWYFNLKDEKCQIAAVMFKGFNQRLKISMVDGIEVIVRARVTVYEPRGSYQLMCEVVEEVGVGTLQKQFEKLKQKLASEGLFAPERKRVIPRYPTRICVVTSPTGAAIKDILSVLERRFKYASVTLIPTQVQGGAAASDIVRSIELANSVRPAFDVLIVGRGGGSIEDLWAFNEEIVARAIAKSDIPVVSAVGHEIDFTISDFVADLRAPTPSAAAELVVPSSEELAARIQKFERFLVQLILSKIQNHLTRLNRFRSLLQDPKQRLRESQKRNLELVARLTRSYLLNIESQRQDLDVLGIRQENAVQKLIARFDHRLKKSMALLHSLSPLAIVERGFAIVQKEGQIIKESSALRLGDQVSVQLARGGFKAVVSQFEK